jgi:hypothetical protein
MLANGIRLNPVVSLAKITGDTSSPVPPFGLLRTRSSGL